MSRTELTVGLSAGWRKPALGLLVFLMMTPWVGAQESSAYTHEPVWIGKKKIEVGEGRKTQRIESVSAYCLSCHSPEASDAPRAARSVGGAHQSHPVDLAYPERSAYTPATALDKKLTLIDGKVVCTTCHDPKASDHRLLLALDRSQLCLACHKS